VPTILRVLTLNLWSADELMPGRLALVERGLRELAPDVVGLQEVREVPGRQPNTARVLAQACGYSCAFASAARPDHPEDFGVAILSRRAIVEHTAVDLPRPEDSERRVLLSARVETAAGPIWVHTTHLNYRLQDGPQREEQVQTVDAAVAARASDRPQIVMGDFNARPESDEIRWLRGLHPLESGWTWSSTNPYTDRYHFLEPDRRLDYVFVTPARGDGRGRIHACRIVLDRPDANGVWASDHFGVWAEVQLDAG